MNAARLLLCVVAVSSLFVSRADAQAPPTREQKVTELKAQILLTERRLASLRSELKKLTEVEEAPKPVPSDLSGTDPKDPAGFRTVYRKTATGWTRRPAKEGFRYSVEENQLVTTAAEGGELVYVPAPVKDGETLLGPGWYEPEFAAKAVLPKADPNSTLTSGDLSAPLPDDPAGWFTIYVFQQGQYHRRKVVHAPDVTVSNGHILTTAKEGKMNYLPDRVSHDGKLLPPGWYKPADPGEVVR